MNLLFAYAFRCTAPTLGIVYLLSFQRLLRRSSQFPLRLLRFFCHRGPASSMDRIIAYFRAIIVICYNFANQIHSAFSRIIAVGAILSENVPATKYRGM